MKNLLKRFWNEEDGSVILEVVLVIAIVVAAAIIFRNLILPWVKTQTSNTLEQGSFDPNEMAENT